MATFKNNGHVTTAPNVGYTKVRGTYMYVPYLYRTQTGERVYLPAYSRLEDAVQAVERTLTGNDTLQRHDTHTPRLEDVTQYKVTALPLTYCYFPQPGLAW